MVLIYDSSNFAKALEFHVSILDSEITNLHFDFAPRKGYNLISCISTWFSICITELKIA